MSGSSIQINIPSTVSSPSPAAVDPASGMPTTYSTTGSMDVSDALLSANNQAQTAYQSIARGGGGGGGAGLTIAKEAATQSGQANADIATLDNAAAMKLKADNERAMSMFGWNSDGGAMSVATLSQQASQTEAKVAQEQQALSEHLGQGFMDDPLQWLVNQFTIPYEAKKLMADTASVSQQLDVLKKLGDLTEQSYRINAGVDTAASTARETALRTLAFAQAKQRLADATFTASSLDIQSTNVRLAATRDAFDASVAVNNAHNETLRLGLAEQGLQLQTKELDLNTIKTQLETDANNRAAAMAPFNELTAKLQSDNLQQVADAKVELNSRLANVSKMYGLQPVTVEMFQAMPDNPLKQWLTQQAMNPNIQDGRYGFDATNSIQIVNKTELPLTPGARITAENLQKTMNSVIGPEALTFKQLPDAVQHMRIQNGIIDEINKEKGNIPDAGGLYSPPPLVSTLSIGAVAATDIGKTLMSAANSDPNHATKAQEVMATASLLIQQGKLTIPQAAEQVAQIYNAIMADNTINRQYGRFALPTMDATTGYHQTVSIGNVLGSAQNVDLSDSGAVATVLTRMNYYKGATGPSLIGP